MYFIIFFSRSGRRTDAETGVKVTEELCGKVFGEDVSIPKWGRDVKNTDMFKGNIVTNKMNVNFDVLVLDWVAEYIDNADFIVIYKGCFVLVSG